MDYSAPMFEVIQSDIFRTWFAALRHAQVRALVVARNRRAIQIAAEWKE